MKKLFSISILIFSVFHFPFSVKAQVRPVYDYGASGLGQTLKKLQTTKSVMMIGAHPDDEDSALLAFLARGENARTAYLSLTRGDGGQNLIGDELFESLGVIRTEELLQARRLDGAEQFFTRAFDYGFSKTLDEAKEKWDEKIVLCDVVAAIRYFRPLVVIARFTGTAADGHGQHQYAGYISPLAVKAAADSAQCTNNGIPWQVKKFYVSLGFRSEAEPTLKINTGKYDPIIGRSYFEIAMEGRSQHKTQEQGVLELKGDQFSRLNLIESKAEKIEREQRVFDGLDTTILGQLNIEDLPKDIPKQNLYEIQKAIEKAIQNYEPENPQKIVPELIEGLEKVRQSFSIYSCVETASRRYGGCDEVYSEKENKSLKNISNFLGTKNTEFNKIIALALGVRFEALADREMIKANEEFSVAVRGFIPENVSAKIIGIEMKAPVNWKVEKSIPVSDPTQSFRRENSNFSENFKIRPNLYNSSLTQPYWLIKKRESALFTNVEDKPEENHFYPKIVPFDPPFLNIMAIVEFKGKQIYVYQPVEYRFADDVRGEIRRELNVVPKISLEFEKDFKLVNQTESLKSQNAVLKITNNSEGAVDGNVYLTLPDGKTAVSLTKAFSLKQKGERTTAKFEIKLPQNLKNGKYEIKAVANINGEKFTRTMHTISYPHIQTHRYYTEAKTAFNILDLQVALVRVGYIMGSGDRVPQAIEELGLNVTMIDENYLSSGDLSKFDTIVAGIRASQTRPDFAANNKRLIEFMTNGGTLIVQYQQYEYARANLPPYPAKMESNIRTVDENAPVKILAPENPIFNFPNKITEKDFDDWVQERNLYTFTSFDEKYTPLLETHDAGEAESRGGMVYAEVGKGRYVYTAYSFFRQLPAGNEGAFRLFANLLSLPKSGK